MNFDIRVDPEHFAYLRLQKGSLDSLANDFPKWKRRYDDDLLTTFEQIKPHLPQLTEERADYPPYVLDIGSGLGGIDILIRRHYEKVNGLEVNVSLLDGIADPPEMTLHRKTFNDMKVALNFQVKNGLNPLRFAGYGPTFKQFEQPFDLVVSFGSWCFHYPPEVYLPALLASGLHRGSIVILDVRTKKPDYMRQLEAVLELQTMVALKVKFSRCVFKVKAGALYDER